MTMALSNFDFIRTGWPDPVADAAERAEHYARRDPRTACFYARRAFELAVRHELGIDAWSRDQHQPLGTLIWEVRPLLKGHWEHAKNVLVGRGNAAVHQEQSVSESEAVHAVKVLHHVLTALARDQRTVIPTFDESLLTGSLLSNPASAEQVRTLENALEEKDREVASLQLALDRAPSAEEADALEHKLTLSQAAYERLLATRAMTSSRFLHGLGSMPFEGLLNTIREGSERPDEQDEAAAVVLEALAERYVSLLSSSIPHGV